MTDWEVPGLGILVVKDNKVVFKKGYGVRKTGTTDQVDTQTLFVCASTTKAMTAACMGMLVDEGKLKWDDPVVSYLPDFQLYDPFVTRELRIRDLFIHDSGVGNTDFLWAFNSFSSDEVLYRMRFAKPVYSMRSSFIYQNIFYLAAGKVIEKVSGITWAAFIRKRLFQPLGMTRTQALLKDVKDANHAAPHFRIENKITPIVRDTADAVAPAGSVSSCVDDLALWTMCMIDSSKYAGGRLVQPATWMELFKPQVLVPESQFYPTAQLTHPHWMTYALGWFQHDYKGRKLNFHTGSLNGAIAIHGQLPEEKTGVFVLGNLDHAELRHALMYKAFDEFALGGNRDWSSEFLKLYGDIRAKAEKEQAVLKARRIPDTKPSLPLEAYAGTYSDVLYGNLKLVVENGALKSVLSPKTSGTLTHWHYDTFLLKFDENWNDDELISFQLDASGKVSGLKMGGMQFGKK